MKQKLIIIFFFFKIAISAETPWMVYMEPAANDQKRLVVYDIGSDSLITDFFVNIQGTFLGMKFFSNTGIIGYTSEDHLYKIDIKNKKIEDLPELNGAAFNYNQDIWIILYGDTCNVNVPGKSFSIDVKNVITPKYREIVRFEWVLKKEEAIYIGVLTIDDKNKYHRVLIKQNRDGITCRNIVNKTGLLFKVQNCIEEKSNPYNDNIGLIYTNSRISEHELVFFDLQKNELVHVASDVDDFIWLNNDSLALFSYNHNTDKYQIDLYNSVTKDRDELFQYDHIGFNQNLCYFNKSLYFKHFSRFIEIFTKIKFRKYNLLTKKVIDVLEFNKSRDSYYEYFDWDIRIVNLED